MQPPVVVVFRPINVADAVHNVATREVQWLGHRSHLEMLHVEDIVYVVKVRVGDDEVVNSPDAIFEEVN